MELHGAVGQGTMVSGDIKSTLSGNKLDNNKVMTGTDKIELHWGQNPLNCLLLLFLYQNCFCSCLRLPLIRLIDV